MSKIIRFDIKACDAGMGDRAEGYLEEGAGVK
jgi:hypothetical protein